jgi:hypothetical protein
VLLPFPVSGITRYHQYYESNPTSQRHLLSLPLQLVQHTLLRKTYWDLHGFLHIPNVQLGRALDPPDGSIYTCHLSHSVAFHVHDRFGHHHQLHNFRGSIPFTAGISPSQFYLADFLSTLKVLRYRNTSKTRYEAVGYTLLRWELPPLERAPCQDAP